MRMSWLWQLATTSNDRAVHNARMASTALSRRRVERDEVELFLRVHGAARPSPTRVRRPA